MVDDIFKDLDKKSVTKYLMLYGDQRLKRRMLDILKFKKRSKYKNCVELNQKVENGAK